MCESEQVNITVSVHLLLHPSPERLDFSEHRRYINVETMHGHNLYVVFCVPVILNTMRILLRRHVKI